MEDVNMEVMVKTTVRDIQSALRRLTGNFSYLIKGQTGLYAAIHQIISRMKTEKLLQEWWISSYSESNDFSERNVEINLRFDDPVGGLQAARDFEQVVATP